MIDLDEAAFQQRPELKSHLAYESFVSLASRPCKELIVDRNLQGRTMKSGFLLAISFMLSRRLTHWTSKNRVGILFPPGLGAYIANLAVVLAGKVPVNLNFTLGPSSAAACLQKAEVDCLLTSEQVQHKIPHFPWPESGIIDLVEEMKSMPKAKTLALLSWIHLCPAKLLAKILKVPAKGGELEAWPAFY
jgi:acyl-[acyl-carrier-protein]-phospholipid O-acyltransferase/long-chain-fatty-acid--[acyl-carrier-protein] ligase